MGVELGVVQETVEQVLLNSRKGVIATLFNSFSRVFFGRGGPSSCESQVTAFSVLMMLILLASHLVLVGAHKGLRMMCAAWKLRRRRQLANDAEEEEEEEEEEKEEEEVAEEEETRNVETINCLSRKASGKKKKKKKASTSSKKREHAGTTSGGDAVSSSSKILWV